MRGLGGNHSPRAGSRGGKPLAAGGNHDNPQKTLSVAHPHAGNPAHTGNATTATQLQTARTISLSGGATGTATSFNGTANVTIPVTGLDMSKATAGTLTAARGGTGRTDGRATALATARTISLTGDATGSVSFDGSANVSLPVNIKVGIMPSNSMSVYAGAGYPASPIITINA